MLACPKKTLLPCVLQELTDSNPLGRQLQAHLFQLQLQLHRSLKLLMQCIAIAKDTAADSTRNPCQQCIKQQYSTRGRKTQPQQSPATCRTTQLRLKASSATFHTTHRKMAGTVTVQWLSKAIMAQCELHTFMAQARAPHTNTSHTDTSRQSSGPQLRANSRLPVSQLSAASPCLLPAPRSTWCCFCPLLCLELLLDMPRQPVCQPLVHGGKRNLLWIGPIFLCPAHVVKVFVSLWPVVVAVLVVLKDVDHVKPAPDSVAHL